MGIDTKIVDNKYLAKQFIIPAKIIDPKWGGFNMYYFPLDKNDRIMPREGEFD